MIMCAYVKTVSDHGAKCFFFFRRSTLYNNPIYLRVPTHYKHSFGRTINHKSIRRLILRAFTKDQICSRIRLTEKFHRSHHHFFFLNFRPTVQSAVCGQVPTLILFKNTYILKFVRVRDLYMRYNDAIVRQEPTQLLIDGVSTYFIAGRKLKVL